MQDNAPFSPKPSSLQPCCPQAALMEGPSPLPRVLPRVQDARSDCDSSLQLLSSAPPQDKDGDGKEGKAAKQASKATQAKPSKRLKPDPTGQGGRGKPKLDPRTAEFLRLIFDTEAMKQSLSRQNIDLEKMPLGSLSEAQVQDGYALLRSIAAILQEAKHQHSTSTGTSPSPSPSASASASASTSQAAVGGTADCAIDLAGAGESMRADADAAVIGHIAQQRRHTRIRALSNRFCEERNPAQPIL